MYVTQRLDGNKLVGHQTVRGFHINYLHEFYIMFPNIIILDHSFCFILQKIPLVVYVIRGAEKSSYNPRRLLILFLVFVLVSNLNFPLFEVPDCNLHHSLLVYYRFDRVPHERFTNQATIIVPSRPFFPNASVGKN